MKTRRKPVRAFTLVELLLVLACLALLVSLLLPALSGARRNGRLARCMGNLRNYAAATPVYASEFRDALWAFSWRAGNTSSQYPDLRGATSDCQAAADQAVDILRRRAERSELPRIENWIAHPLYSQLTLVDFLSGSLPERTAVCPEDRHRLLWQSDPGGFDRGAFQPSPSEGQGPSWYSRWPYSASYQVPTCTFDGGEPGHRVEQWPSQCDGYLLPSQQRFGGRKLSAVSYPSQKVHTYDRHQRHFSQRQPFFGVASCRQPVLHFDGSLLTRFTARANPGWQPNDPVNPQPTTIHYFPQPWDPPAVAAATEDVGVGAYRWTRGGLAGIDFAGAEISTGQPRP